jgi:hypothetical protein
MREVRDGLLDCSRCGEWVPVELFGRQTTRDPAAGGYQRWCHGCLAQYRRERYKPKLRWVLRACHKCGVEFEDREKFFNRRGGGLSRSCRGCNRRWRDWS